MDYTKLSKEVSYALRHAPWEYELELDEKGFVPIEQLLSAINASENFDRRIARSDLEHIIDTSDKVRHEIEGDRIRALYGHTVPGRIVKELATPPPVLYHGTTHEALPAIMEKGLLPMGRQYVHLSTDVTTAQRVGSRRDLDPVILSIDAERASAQGLSFYRGNERVWLADAVPADYIEFVTPA